MQGTASEPRQIRKEAAAGRWHLCRSVPELFRKGFFIRAEGLIPRPLGAK